MIKLSNVLHTKEQNTMFSLWEPLGEVTNILTIRKTLLYLNSSFVFVLLTARIVWVTGEGYTHGRNMKVISSKCGADDNNS